MDFGLGGSLGGDNAFLDWVETAVPATAVIGVLVELRNGRGEIDDIDHLGNRRVKTVGELVQNKLRIGLRRMERVIKERMSIRDSDQTTPLALINAPASGRGCSPETALAPSAREPLA